MMKRILFFSLFFLPLSLKAAFIESYNLLSASYTITNEGPVVISSTPAGTVFMGVEVASPSATGTLNVYDSSVGTATKQIANISLATVNDYPYEVLLSSGLTYTTTNNTSGITIKFKRTRPQ